MNLQVLVLPMIGLSLFGYLFGSISFSIILTKIFIKEDVRKHGSGNAGMTNVLRIAGKLPAILTFVFDFLKCVVPVLVSNYFIGLICKSNEIPYINVSVVGSIVAVCCVLGHIFPIYFGFKGGKGVVTTSAMMAIIDWRVFVAILCVFAITFAIKKIVSLSSIVSAVAYPILTFSFLFFIDFNNQATGVTADYIFFMTVISFLVGLIVIVKHKDNVKRLLNGSEKPIFSKKTA